MSSLNNLGNSFIRNDWKAPGETQNKTKQSMFRWKTGQEWLEYASTLAPLRKIFGDLWYENELCILFSDTNVGKTAIAIQIADAISRGVGMYPLDNEMAAQKVLYVDFEMSTRQFHKRYSNENGWKQFSPNFIRAEVIGGKSLMPSNCKSFAEFTIGQIKELMNELGCKFVFIDNLTAICKNMEKGSEAIELMDSLNEIKKEFDASIMAIGHAPKRDGTKSLERVNLGGSANMANFCDSMMGLAKGANNERYVKQLKTRGSDYVYDARNVLVFDLHKDDQYLEFEFGAYASENQLLTADWISQEEVMQMHKKGITTYEIAQVHKTYPNKIKRIIAKEMQKQELQSRSHSDFQNFADSQAKNLDTVPF